MALWAVIAWPAPPRRRAGVGLAEPVAAFEQLGAERAAALAALVEPALLQGRHGDADEIVPAFRHHRAGEVAAVDLALLHAGFELARGGRAVDMPVESLAIGDVAVTASGGSRPIVWIGHRTMI